MDGDWNNECNKEALPPSADFVLAHFHADLQLPMGAFQLLKDASAAIRQEYRECSRWKRLRCRKVSLFAERDRGTIVVLHVGSSVEFDWTWEGAVAFRPKSLDDNPAVSNLTYEDTAFDDEIVWKGEVVEVDERNGCLFISLDNPEAMPTTGSFFVRPFEFLSVLDSVYNETEFECVRNELPHRLSATQGGIHPVIATQSHQGLSQLRTWWQHSWSVLWGPPGTGKTWTTGQQIAAVLEDPTERILVVSTTNRATDAVALSIGNAVRKRSLPELDEGRLLRIGKGVSIAPFKQAGLESMLRRTESEVLIKIDELAGQLRLFDTWEEKALTRKHIAELRRNQSGNANHNFVDPEVRVAVCTAFKAMSSLKQKHVNKMLQDGEAPFTTIFVDEAGLISRTAIAALSLLAARRVVLVGDSKQLAPISRISRILPARQQNWLASSGLNHLDAFEDTPEAVHVLSQQYRMHPDVCRVVSEYQYGGLLETADETKNRESVAPQWITSHSRAIWYVLDEEGSDLASIRAERGPGNKSWVRSGTPSVLQKLLADPNIQKSEGLFVSPYKAQAQTVSKLFSQWRLKSWQASTVHSQQGTEADIVIFDTVNAGSYNWPFDEWKRLVNVALSRAREAIIVLASQSEMQEPYLKPLMQQLTPSILVDTGESFRWKTLDAVGDRFRQQLTSQEPSPRKPSADQVAEKPTAYSNSSQPRSGIGHQVTQRKSMTLVLSQEQQRLTNLKLDGKPRLVRGVAGSGKSIVLCNWLAKTVQRLGGNNDFRVWAVYANRSLHQLLRESVESAWRNLFTDQLFEQPEFPWENVSLLHVKDVLAGIMPSVSLSIDTFEFDYDRAAEEFLNRQDAVELLPRCSALFIDEAQDMGPFTLKLLLSLVEQTDPEDPNSRSAHIFYDNAQNIYGRKTPTWPPFGLDMRGRSSIMRESFRSTIPITELAVNVLHRLTPPNERLDQNELMKMGLIEKEERNGTDWLRVRFNQIQGPKPIFHAFQNRTAELDAIANHVKHLIQREGILPSDICLIYNSKAIVQLLETRLGPMMTEIGVELSVQTNRPYERRDNTLVVTTSHSYKGYESEVVMIPCVDQFVTGDGKILANNLYVAMTRARSLLAIYGLAHGSTASRQLCQTMNDCVKAMNSTQNIETSTSAQDDLNDISDSIGVERREWLVDLWQRFEIHQEPILATDGTILAAPIFWFEYGDELVACFDNDSSPNEEPPVFPGRRLRTLKLGDTI